MFGLGQGFLPVVGFSFGAKKFDRIKKAYFFTTTLGIKGLELCQPIANIVSALICVPFIIFYFKTQDKTQTNNPPSDK